mgnify:CR=1 FL=1
MKGSYAFNYVYLHTKPNSPEYYWATGDAYLFENIKNLADSKKKTGIIEQQKQRLEGQIKALKGQEEAVYKQYFKDCADYKDFIGRIRDLFDKHSTDMLIIQNFSSEKIRALLIKTYGSHWTGSSDNQRISLDIEVENPKPIEIKFDKLKKNNANMNGITFSGKTIKINLGVSEKEIKEFKQYINTIFKTQFHTTSSNPKAITEAMENMVNKGLREFDNIANIQVGEETLKALQTTQLVLGEEGQSTPFSLKKQDIDNAEKSGDAARIKEALSEIRSFLFEKVGIKNGTSDLKKAFYKTWKDTIEGDIRKSAFFLKGGNLNYLAGAFGEYQTALLSNYILYRTDAMSSAVASKISNTIGQAEQSKVDVTILEKIGVQVKNYNPYTYDRNPIPTTTTASAFLDKMNYELALLEQNGEQQNYQAEIIPLTSFLANYAFSQEYRGLAGSKGIPSVEEVEGFLSNFAGELYNLSINSRDNKAFSDTVLFYSFSGKYLVPASAILQAAYQNLKDNGRTGANASIKWGGSGLSAEDMNKGQGPHNSPYWTLYWHRVKNPGTGAARDYWKPQTEKQDSEINNLLSKVRIHAGFKTINSSNNKGKMNVNGRLNLDDYKLF